MHVISQANGQDLISVAQYATTACMIPSWLTKANNSLTVLSYEPQWHEAVVSEVKLSTDYKLATVLII